MVNNLLIQEEATIILNKNQYFIYYDKYWFIHFNLH